MQDLIDLLRNEVARIEPNLRSSIPLTSYVLQSPENETPTLESGSNLSSDHSSDDESNEDEPFMASFMMTLDVVKEAINEIERRTNDLRYQREQLTTAYNRGMEEKIKMNVHKINVEQNAAVQAVQQVLQGLDADNKMFKEQNPNSAEGRIRANLHTFISRKFKEVLSHFHGVQSEYALESKNRMERQVNMALPDYDPEEISALVEKGQIVNASQVIETKLKHAGTHQSINFALQDITDKYADVKALEKNVAELQQMFVDLGAMVEANGDMLDCIEYNVGEAVEFMDKGISNVEKARKKQKKNAKKATWCALGVALAVAILCLIIFI